MFEATGGDLARTMAITGHTSAKTLQTYIADANRERLGDEAIDAVQVMLDRRDAARAMPVAKSATGAMPVGNFPTGTMAA